MEIKGDLKVTLGGVEVRLMECPECNGRGWYPSKSSCHGPTTCNPCPACAGSKTLAILPYPVVFDLLQKKAEEEKKKSGIQT